MKTLFIISLCLYSFSSSAKDNSRGLGFLSLLCPVCGLTAVIVDPDINEKKDINKERIKRNKFQNQDPSQISRIPANEED